MNVLAISCHPDDMEVYCGGTLLKCKERGDTVTVGYKEKKIQFTTKARTASVQTTS